MQTYCNSTRQSFTVRGIAHLRRSPVALLSEVRYYAARECGVVDQPTNCGCYTCRQAMVNECYFVAWAEGTHRLISWAVDAFNYPEFDFLSVESLLIKMEKACASKRQCSFIRSIV